MKNRTIFTGDNLDIMRGMESETVDLVYLDPPFNSNHNYAAPIGSQAAGAEFKDTWNLNDVDEAWWGEIAETNDGLYKVLDAAGAVGGGGRNSSTKSYLIYMAIRILEMRRLLKDTGTLYLHCDPTMSHYLKLSLDAIFEPTNFRNEIIWCYSGGGRSKRGFGKKHDVILRYSKSGNFRFYGDNVRIPYTIDPTKRTSDRAWGSHGTDKVYRPNEGGKIPEDWWHIPQINSQSKERLGYPTQKPLEILERIIKSSTREGELVFDPFCGCATACSAAEKLNRKWIGIDISEKAHSLIKLRLKKEAGMDEFTKGAGIVIHRTDVPVRGGTKSPQIKHLLFGKQEGRCAGCGIEYNFKDLEIDHIVPKAKGGPDIDGNLQLLCGHCNRVKGGKRTMPELKAALVKMNMRGLGDGLVQARVGR